MNLPDSPQLPPVFVPVTWADLPAPIAKVSAAQWRERLFEYLPEDYIDAHACALSELYRIHATPHQAATYALTFGLPDRAPSLLSS